MGELSFEDNDQSVAWQEFGKIVGLFTVVGVLVGVPIYFTGLEPMPWRALPFIVLVAWPVAFAFAVVAAVFASIARIVLAKRGSLRQQSSLHRVAGGVLLGALVGAVHPFVVVFVIGAGFHAEGAFAFGGLRLTAATMIAGAVAGGVVLHRYGLKVVPSA